MGKSNEYQKELDRWNEIFKNTEENTRTVAAGLIEKAASLHAKCYELDKVMEASGIIKIHPEHPDIQKPIPALKEYARLTESYANIVNKLNNLRLKNPGESEDEFEKFMQEMKTGE